MSNDMHDRAGLESVTLEALALLQKTVDYLNRLPPVPITRQLVKEIEEHLAAPFTRSAKREAEEHDLRRKTLVGEAYSPAGVPTWQAQIVGDTLHFGIADAEVVDRDIPELQERLLKSLAQGITLKLGPAPQGHVLPKVN